MTAQLRGGERLATADVHAVANNRSLRDPHVGEEKVERRGGSATCRTDLQDAQGTMKVSAS